MSGIRAPVPRRCPYWTPPGCCLQARTWRPTRDSSGWLPGPDGRGYDSRSFVSKHPARGVAVPNMPETDVAAVCERLRAEGVDGVRGSYRDLTGVAPGPDGLPPERPAATGPRLPFCPAAVP